MRPLEHLLRKHILAVKPYSSARSEYPTSAKESTEQSTNTAQTLTFLDANENAFGSPADLQVNRYPDPLQITLKERIAVIKSIPNNRTNTIFLGNGSDEPIDLIMRAFCEPMQPDAAPNPALHDNIIITPPTYGMYEVSAAIHNVYVNKVPLIKDAQGFRLNTDAVLNAVTPSTKLIFLCSPNNPTANVLQLEAIEQILRTFQGIVILDEAYIDFAAEHSFLPRLQEFPNLIILQTFSKAWGMAGLRLGMAFANERIVAVLNNIKPPYNINILAQEAALRALQDVSWQERVIKETREERQSLLLTLKEFPFVRRIFPSDANFLLVEMDDAKTMYRYLVEHGVIVRDRSSVALCEDCLRITVGTSDENKRLVSLLQRCST